MRKSPRMILPLSLSLLLWVLVVVLVEQPQYASASGRPLLATRKRSSTTSRSRDSHVVATRTNKTLSSWTVTTQQLLASPPPPPQGHTAHLFSSSWQKLRGGGGARKKTVAPTSSTKKKQSQLPQPQGASIPSEVFNLVKAIVGVGVLSLPAGVAAFGSAPSSMIPAAALITIIGILSAFGFALIGRVCAYTGATSYREAWSLSVGSDTSWIPAWSTTTKTFLACVSFSMVLADTFSVLTQQERTKTLLVVTTVILLPLCLMKELKKLAPFSLVGVLGMAYTACSMALRYFDGTYAMPDGSMALKLAAEFQPTFGDKGMASVFSSNALILLCMLSTAFMCHFSAPRYYWELENHTLPRFHSVVQWSFGMAIVLMATITTLGFLTFGTACSGLVLNNYYNKDAWMSASRIAVAISLGFSYPLVFVGFRDGVVELMQVEQDKQSDGLLNSVTVVLLGIITSLACTLKDVSLVLAMGGATLGNALTYLYPALMYRATVKQQNRKEETIQVWVAMTSAAMGVVMGAIGAKMALQGAGGGH